MRRAMAPESDAVIVETVTSEDPRHDFPAASDLLMYVLASGREWTKERYLQLFERSVLHVRRQDLLATGATAFTLRLS